MRVISIISLGGEMYLKCKIGTRLYITLYSVYVLCRERKICENFMLTGLNMK